MTVLAGPETWEGAAVSLLRVCIDQRKVSPRAINGTGVYALELQQRLRRVELVSGAADVLHRPSQFFDATELEAYLAAQKRVITFLDLIAYRTPFLFRSAELHRAYCELSRRALLAADQVIAISEHARRELQREFGLENVTAIPLGVDAEFFARPAPRVYEGRYYLCTGSDYPHKNLHALLRGYAWLRAQWPQAPDLVLCGPPSGAEGGVYAWGRELAAGVTYLGAVPRAELPGLYQHATAFVYPSTYEGFGLPVLEAMAAGTPVVCSPLTSLPEVAGDAALYLRDFSLDDFAHRLREVTTAGQLKERGRERAKQFTWEETARRTEEIYFKAQPINL